ncbi:hypothetical protein [Rhizobium sp. BR 314]|uniref:hypothetical protein n=1 Tax=Rhizobium sp. BR 314 TaxID=3040013 RepID=UPI0039BEF3EB
MKPETGSDMLEFLDAIHRKGLLEFSGNRTPDAETGLLLKHALESSLIRAGDAHGQFGLCFVLTGKGRHVLGLKADVRENDAADETLDAGSRRREILAIIFRLTPAICFIGVLCGIVLSLLIVRR